MKVNDIFCINLSDHIDRWTVLKQIPNIVRVDAIDTRLNKFDYLKYDFILDPICDLYVDYFSTSPGATGCFLSHYIIWKKIIEDNLTSALILEDDVDINDVIKLSNDGILFDKGIDCCQLNKRTEYTFPAYGQFNGTESYIITKTGCEKMIYILEHPDIIIKSFVLPKQHLDTSMVIDDALKNSIMMPVDAFIGYCSSIKIPADIRLNISVSHKIGLNIDLKNISDVTTKKPCKIHNVPMKDRGEFRSKVDYKWWERITSFSS